MRLTYRLMGWFIGVIFLLSACSGRNEGIDGVLVTPTPIAIKPVLTWHKENKTNSYCEEVKLYRNGVFIHQSCLNGDVRLRGELDETHLQLMMTALEKYPFLDITHPDPGEGAEEWILFLGDNQTREPDEAPPPEIFQLFSFIQSILNPPASEEAGIDANEIAGSICYPGERPQPVEIFFYNQLDDSLYQMLHMPEANTFSAPLPPGDYRVFAWATDAQVGGGYTGERACSGHGVLCSEVDLATTILEEDGASQEVAICSWGLIGLPFPWKANNGASLYAPSDLSGLVFNTEIGLQQMMSPDTAQEILPAQQGYISPDRTYVLYAEDGDLRLFKPGVNEDRQLTNTPDRVEHPTQWQVTRTGKLLFLMTPSVDAPGLQPKGYLSAINLDGSEYQVLDAERPTQSFALAPDGETIAYGVGGQAWLYHPMIGSQPLDFSVYTSVEFSTVMNPAWSPDGRWLAWLVVDGEERASILILDMHEPKSILVLPHQPPSPEFFQGAGVWSPDSQWFAVNLYDVEPDLTGIWVVNPASGYAPISLGKAGNPIWRPDSKQLLLFSFETAGWLLADSETWKTEAINGPPGANYPTQWLQP